MIYGLWFEPERVVRGTWLHENRPEWILAAGSEPQGTYLLNFGLPEFQDRLLFGTDLCFPGMPIDIVDLLLDWRDTGKITEEVFHKVARGNAVRLLQLE